MTDTPILVPNVKHVTFVSRFMGDNPWGFNIFLPPSYETATSRRFPVIYFCHGLGDDEYTWVERGLPLRLQQAMITGRSPDMIMVFLSGGEKTFFNNHPPSEMPESYITEELIPYIDAHFRTIPDRSGRSIEGFSMGGYGALKYAFEHPNLFSDVVAYAPSIWYADTPDHDMLNVARSYGPQLRTKLKIRLVIGLDGDSNLSGVQEFHELLNSLSIPNDCEQVPGVGHDVIGLYDADGGDVGIRGLDFHADNFFGGTRVPTDLQATASTPSRVDLSWTSVAGAKAYEIQRSRFPDHGFSSIATVSSLSYQDDVSASTITRAYYKVCAVYPNTRRDYSEVVSTSTMQ